MQRLNTSFEATTAQLKNVRAIVDRFLRSCEIAPSDWVLIATELMTNAIESGDGSDVELTVTVDDRIVALEVSNSGEGFSLTPDRVTTSHHRGRGLMIVQQLVDDLTISVIGGRTVVRSQRTLNPMAPQGSSLKPAEQGPPMTNPHLSDPNLSDPHLTVTADAPDIDEDHRYDVAVIGLGSAGEALATELAGQGKRVVGFEPNLVGGECPFTACMPSKALLHRGHARRSGDQAPTEWTEAIRHRDDVVDGLDDTQHVEGLHDAGVTVVRQRAAIVGPHLVESDEVLWYADHVVLATGSRPVMPPIGGLAEADVWTAADALTSAELPPKIAIIGGGPVGCELADIYSAFGSAVVVLERAERLLPDHDRAVAGHHLASLRSLGIDIRLGVEVASIESIDNGQYRLTLDGKNSNVDADRVIVAAGQTPRLDDVGLDCLEPPVEDQPDVDAYFRPPRHNWLFVIGDANGMSPWTHGANREASIIARTIGGGAVSRLDVAMPHCVFTDPPAAHVGRSSQAMTDEGRRSVRGEGRLTSIARFSTDELNDGVAVLTVDAQDRTVVGASASGALADELIATATTWVHLEATIDQISFQVFAFPTISQVWEVAIDDALEKLRTS